MPSHKHPPSPWWKRYPEVESRFPQEPGPDDIPDPHLDVGARVRLYGKPDRVRAIERVEWHRYRYRYVYEIETSGGSVPYWFADQLMLEGKTQPLPERSQQPAGESLLNKLTAFWRNREA